MHRWNIPNLCFLVKMLIRQHSTSLFGRIPGQDGGRAFGHIGEVLLVGFQFLLAPKASEASWGLSYFCQGVLSGYCCVCESGYCYV